MFIDGAFWHGHPQHFTFGKLGTYWDEKVRRTQARDREQEEGLRKMGYQVIRFWDFEVKDDAERCARLVSAAVARAREGVGKPTAATA